MHPADAKAHTVLENLRERFLHAPAPHHELVAAPDVLIGFEIEVPWRAYFPDTWKRFLAGERTYQELTPEDQARLSSECRTIEHTLLPRLQATVEAGLKRGLDLYWEFAFPPVNDVEIAHQITRALVAEELLPWGHHSLHATISGVPEDSSLLAALTLLELVFVREERILQGFQGRGAWARKGRGGIYRKDRSRLEYDSEYAIELRTLELPATPEECRKLFAAIAHLSYFLSIETERFATAKRRVGDLLRAHRLPATVWNSPGEEPDVWREYATHIAPMRAEAMHILVNDLGFSL